jgi:DNA-binding NarL/FixJ family response regulator
MTSTKTSTAAISILIVDDHPVFRAGLANLLEAEPDFRVVEKVSSGEAAIRAVRERRPAIVLLDLSMPGIDGFETLSRIQAASGMARVVALTSSEARDDADRVRAAGGAGYLTKHVDHAEIVAAIRAVAHGTEWVQRGLLKVAALPVAANRQLGVSARESEVLGLVRHGYSNAEIGKLLGITERTAKAHVKALCEKLGASDRAEAVARGFDLGLLKAEGGT